PNAAPLMAAITGRGKAAIASTTELSDRRKERVSSSVIARRSLRSAPAQKAFSPAPVRITARTVSSVRARENMCPSAPTSSIDRALAAPGRSSVTRATPSRISSNTGNSASPILARDPRTGADGGAIELRRHLVAHERRRQPRAIDELVEIDARLHAHPLEH